MSKQNLLFQLIQKKLLVCFVSLCASVFVRALQTKQANSCSDFDAIYIGSLLGSYSAFFLQIWSNSLVTNQNLRNIL